MEERQTQIREGAGLEESKLNVEFIDWLQKWSTPILMVIAVAALGTVVYKKWEKAGLAKVDRAFAEYTAAAEVASPSPESLKGIGDQYEGVRAVAELARLKAADEYVQSVRMGVKNGAKLGQDGAVPQEDVLSDEERTRYLGEAERLYKAVLDKNSANASRVQHAIDAASGLAAVALCRGDSAAATQALEQLIKLAESQGFVDLARATKKRIELIATLGPTPKLYAAADLPKPPEPPKPPTPPGANVLNIPGAGEAGATGATGAEPGATPPPGGPGSTGAPAATGSPAPTGEPPPTGSPLAPK